MLEASRLSQVLKEMTNYKMDLLGGLSETRWHASGELITATGVKKTWVEIKTDAKNRVRWRILVEALRSAAE